VNKRYILVFIGLVLLAGCQWVSQQLPNKKHVSGPLRSVDLLEEFCQNEFDRGKKGVDPSISGFTTKPKYVNQD
jgi:hypothetical protein